MNTRIEALKHLIENEEFSDQKSLIEALFERYGIETNQAAISRDLHKLGVVKKKIGDNLIYKIGEIDPKVEILKLGVEKIVANEAIIVVHTISGLADFVGDYIDEHAHEIEIIGTIAGENVVFVTPGSIHQIKTILTQLCKLLHYSEEI